MAVPALVFAARLSTIRVLQVASFAVAGVFVVIALAGFATVPFSKKRAAEGGLLLMLSALISLGGLILALAPDSNIFLATLVSAAFSLVVVGYERALRRTPSVTRRPAATGAASQAKRRRPQS